MSSTSGRLAGKVALITGAGSGIGYAMTQLFAEQGAKVAAIARQQRSLEQWKNVENVAPLRADITKLDEVNRMIDETERRFGKLDIVCNVAGINDLGYPLDETTDEMWSRSMVE